MFRGEWDWKALHRLDHQSRSGAARSLSSVVVDLLWVSRLVVGGPRGGHKELPVMGSLLYSLGVQYAPLLPDIVPVAVAVDPSGQGGGLSVLAGPRHVVDKAAKGKARHGDEKPFLQQLNC